MRKSTNPITKGRAVTLIVLFIACVSCYSGDRTLIPREIFVPKEFDGGFVLKFQPQVDILFFVDNSGSMDFYEEALAKNIDQFISAMGEAEFLDYHIGVLKIPMGYELDKNSGKLWGNIPVITRDTPEGLFKLRNNFRSIVTGVFGGYSSMGSYREIFFDPLFFALSEEFSSSLNPGFLRSDAFFVLILISDTFDQSPEYSGFNVFNELVKQKVSDQSKLLSYGAIAYPEFFEDDCIREMDEKWSDNLFKFLSRFSNSHDSRIGGGIDFIPSSKVVDVNHYGMTNVFSLCDEDFGKKIANIGRDIRMRVSRKIPLPMRPVDGSIRIRYGDQLVENKWWRYDFKSNSVVFRSEAFFEDQKPDENRKETQIIVHMDEADPLVTLGKPPEKEQAKNEQGPE